MDDFFREYYKVGDLIYFDGPLLSLFTNGDNSSFYLLKWVDVENGEHIWLKFQVNFSLLEKYLEKAETEYELIRSSDEISIITINEGLKITSSRGVAFEELPQSYLPDENVLFDENLSIYKSKIDFILGLIKMDLLDKKMYNLDSVKTHNLH